MTPEEIEEMQADNAQMRGQLANAREDVTSAIALMATLRIEVIQALALLQRAQGELAGR
jgi:hypothetical protein